MYECKYTLIYVNTCIHIYIYMCIYMYIYEVYICIYTYVCILIYVFWYTCIHKVSALSHELAGLMEERTKLQYIYIYMYTYLCILVHMYT